MLQVILTINIQMLKLTTADPIFVMSSITEGEIGCSMPTNPEGAIYEVQNKVSS